MNERIKLFLNLSDLKDSLFSHEPLSIVSIQNLALISDSMILLLRFCMTNVLLNAAIHNLKKDDRGSFQVEFGPTNLASQLTAQRVTDYLFSKYKQRGTKSFGNFTKDRENYPTPGYFEEYIKGYPKEFNKLSRQLIVTLKTEASKNHAAAGGYVFFAHFENERRQYFLVTILKDRWGAQVKDGLELQEIENLDIDGFRYAGRIDLTKWAQKEERYISFLKGKGDVANYFRDFLGCDNATGGRYDTTMLVNALDEFVSNQQMTKDERSNFFEKARQIGDRCAREKEELDFSSFANEMMPDKPDLLREFLVDPDLALQDCFVPDRRVLSRLVRFQAKTKNWQLEFDRKAINSGDIDYHEKNQTLTIKNLPENLIEKLKDEFGSKQ